MKPSSSPPLLSRAERMLLNADRVGPRLWGGLGISVLLNVLLWRAVGGAVLTRQSPPPAPIEIQRIVLTPQGRKVQKTISKKQVARKVQRIQRQIVKRPVVRQPPRLRPRIQPRPDAPVRPEVQTKPEPERPRVTSQPLQPPRPNAPQAPDAPRRSQPVAPTPQGAHHRTLTARNPAAPGAGNVKAGGSANLGKPTEAQNYGSAKTNPSNYTPPTPEPQPTQAPAPVTPPVPPQPEPTSPPPSPPPTPKPTPPPPPPTPKPTTPPPPPPTPPPTPKPTTPPPPPPPKGPTQDAEATKQVQPDIPDELKDDSFKSSVRVRVDVAADGASTPSLRTSSGNAKVDALVLAALRKWRWKPALKDGDPVASTQYFRFNIEVQ